MMRMSVCPFCEIVAGRAEASVVHEDDSVVAILDRRPVTVGHVLVMSRLHVVRLADADDSVGVAVWRTARRLSVALRASGLRCDGVRLSLADGAAAGQDVFHLHLHVVPRYPGDGVVVGVGGRLRARELLDQDAALIREALT